MTAADFRDRIAAMAKRLSDEGLIIKAGWVGYRQCVMASDAPDIQVRECQIAFFAGAQHLFSSIMYSLDPEKEPTDADLRRMDLIDEELRQFAEQFHDRAMPPKGRA